MKFASLCFTLLFSASALAFAPHQRANTVAPLTLYAVQPSRSEFFSQTAAILFAGGAALTGAPYHASAAKYGDFGAGSPGVLDPKTAEVDADILKSETVQSALKKVKGYRTAVQDMQAALKADSQVNVRKTIIKDLDFADLRDTLNTVNSAFEEDTQRGTDRLIRVIMQDITELEQANAQKEGIPRSPRRVEIMEGKLAKLEKAFSDFLAFSA